VLCRDETEDGRGCAVTEENLAFAVHYMFLQIHSHLLIGAEILHRLGNLDAELIAHCEEGIYCAAGGEHYCSIIQDVAVLCPHFDGIQWFDGEKWSDYATNFTIDSINKVYAKLFNTDGVLNELNILLPVGLSFYVFQSTTYLVDVYNKKMSPEKNVLRYAAFVSFFPTILSGPIQKARELLPQIVSPNEFDYLHAKKGTCLFIWGAFEKLLVANYLYKVFSPIYAEYTNFTGVYYLIAAFSFSLYIYSDFSGYSDMARGISMIMGIDIADNFNNPYLSTSTAEFWRRWHVSLNNWFTEYIYIPLGGSRKGVVRKYINIMIIFSISGIWHGSYWHFVAWGVINGTLVVIGQITKPIRNSIYNKLKIDQSLESILLIKRIIVFLLITITWVFFINGIPESIHIISNMFTDAPYRYFDKNLISIAGETLLTLITITMTLIFIVIQCMRIKGYVYFERFCKQPELIQCILLGLVVSLCILAAGASTTEINTQFLYFKF